MQLRPSELTKRKPMMFELPKFEFECITVDLQHIFTGDMMADAMMAERHVETMKNVKMQKLKEAGKVLVAFYANLHENVRIAFLTFVFVDKDKAALKPKKPTIIIAE